VIQAPRQTWGTSRQDAADANSRKPVAQFLGGLLEGGRTPQSLIGVNLRRNTLLTKVLEARQRFGVRHPKCRFRSRCSRHRGALRALQKRCSQHRTPKPAAPELAFEMEVMSTQRRSGSRSKPFDGQGITP
jgi:hypothetical protein